MNAGDASLRSDDGGPVSVPSDGGVATVDAGCDAPGCVPATSAGPVAEVAGGELHTCARTTAGDVYCWGMKVDGRTGSRTDGINKVALPGKAAAVAVGSLHSCAIVGTDLYCWGDKEFLGTGATEDSFEPVKVPIANVARVALGARHTCAVTTGEEVFCWGQNGDGQLGTGDNSNRAAPTKVTLAVGAIAQIAANELTTCLATAAGDAYCWGNAGFSSAAPNVYEPSPARLSVSNVAAIAVGERHVCVKDAAGAVKCLGGGGSGQLGDGAQSSWKALANVVGLTLGVKGIASGSRHSCAVTADDTLRCWGDNSSYQLGDGENVLKAAPVEAKGLLKVAGASGGASHTCAWTTDGTVYCWGGNDRGQVGNVAGTYVRVPTAIRF